MQRDWTSGAGLICQEEDVKLGWREGRREEGGGVREIRTKEGICGEEPQREEPSRIFVLETGINQEADDTSDQDFTLYLFVSQTSKATFTHI